MEVTSYARGWHCEACRSAYGRPPDLSDEAVLERLLALNLERAATE